MKAELAKLLYETGCIKVGDFTLSSGLRSPIYVDLKSLPSHPRAFKRVVGMLVTALENKDFDAVCGLALGGVPLATAVAYELGKPLLYVRKKEKGHGLKTLVEGELRDGMGAVLVDDVATTGGTLARGVRVLRERGIRVKEAVVVVDRLQGAGETLRDLGVKLSSLITLPQLVEALHSEGLLPPCHYERIKSYLRGLSYV